MAIGRRKAATVLLQRPSEEGSPFPYLSQCCIYCSQTRARWSRLTPHEMRTQNSSHFELQKGGIKPGSKEAFSPFSEQPLCPVLPKRTFPLLCGEKLPLKAFLSPNLHTEIRIFHSESLFLPLCGNVLVIH